MAPGDRTARRLVDMAEYPEPELYEPPPKHACDELTMPIDVTDDLKLEVVSYTYKGRVVRFALMLYYVAPDSRPEQVSRIDTCHGQVHRHILRPGGDNTGEIVPIRDIPVDETAWDVVDSEYNEAFSLMEKEAEEFLRRWRR